MHLGFSSSLPTQGIKLREKLLQTYFTRYLTIKRMLSSAATEGALESTPQRRRRTASRRSTSTFVSSNLVLKDELSVCVAGCEYKLHEVQIKLNEHGLTELIINLIMMNTSDGEVQSAFPYEVFNQALKLAVAILNEGNEVVQVKGHTHTTHTHHTHTPHTYTTHIHTHHTHAHIYKCTYIHTYMFTQIHKCTYIHTYMFTQIHKCTYTHTCSHRSTNVHTYTHIHVHTDPQMYIHTHIHVHTDPQMYIHTHMFTQIHKCTYIHTYMFTQIHKCTYIHTYMFTYTPLSLQNTFWNVLNQPSSEKFFKVIHGRFQEAQAEIKNSPTGLIIEQHGNGAVVMETSGRHNSKPKTAKSLLPQWTSDINMEVWNIFKTILQFALYTTCILHVCILLVYYTCMLHNTTCILLVYYTYAYYLYTMLHTLAYLEVLSVSVMLG